jgi:transcriptional regulator with XRE-family HTH domain
MAKSLHTPENQRFRSLLISAREKAGLTQAEVASRLGRPQSFVAKYEGGERRLEVTEFVAVCSALGVDPKRMISALQRRAAR